MCFSKRRTKQIKLFILSSSTESILLLLYLCLYMVRRPTLMYFSTLICPCLQATMIQVNNMQSDYSMRQDLLLVSRNKPPRQFQTVN